MTDLPAPPSSAAAQLARATHGTSGDYVYDVVTPMLRAWPAGGALVDIGCGSGRLWERVNDRFDRYVGLDIAQYDGFPAAGEFHLADLNAGPAPLPDAVGDVVVALGVIECLENPWWFCRELFRIARPGALLVLTTSNQLSLLSKLTILVKNRFNAFQRDDSPLITPILECELRRALAAAGFDAIAFHFSGHGRTPFSRWHWPRWFSHGRRAFSDMLLATAVRPGEGDP